MPYKNKEQQQAAQKAWYEYNKVSVQEKQRLRRTRARAWIRSYKEENSTCLDCGVSYPPHVLDFDHVDGSKEFNISRYAATTDLERIKREIEKCEIVCANCHRIRTWSRQF